MPAVLLSWFGVYDWLYVLASVAMGLATAYIRDPQRKAMLATIPVQFSLGFLAVGAPLDSTNSFACLLVAAYPNTVRLLHDRLHLPILLAIPGGWFAYGGTGAVLARILPRSEAWFWSGLLISLLGGLWLFSLRGKGGGVSQRTPLAVPVKSVALALVVMALVSLKKVLAGFTPLFPVMNTIASWEGSRSLSVQCRQILAFVIAAPGMLAAMRIAEWRGFGPWVVLACGWACYLPVFVPINAQLRRENGL